MGNEESRDGKTVATLFGNNHNSHPLMTTYTRALPPDLCSPYPPLEVSLTFSFVDDDTETEISKRNNH